MEVTAIAKYIRISPQKMGLVVDQIKKMPPAKAVAMLDFINKSASPVLRKVIASAIANAKNNHNLKEDALLFKRIEVASGPASKRYRPISRGRAHTILKRTSHIRVVLEGEPEQELKKQSQELQNQVKGSEERPLIISEEKVDKNGTKS